MTDSGVSAALPIESNVSLAGLTTLGVGGPASFCLRVRSREELLDGLHWADARGLAVFPLGDGSNVVFGDQGFPGLILKLELRGIAWHAQAGRAVVTANAGESWDELVAQAVARGYAGIECLSGIPGRVGGAPIQNIGAYGQEIGARVVRVRAVDAANLLDVDLDGPACRFGYRMSFFKEPGPARRLIVLSVDLELEPNGAPCVAYQELAARLQASGVDRPDLKAVRAAVLALRLEKSMLSDPSDPLSRSAGSFFVNPIVNADDFPAVEARARATGALKGGEALRSFGLPDGRLKLSAAWLIEHSGFPRGVRRGNVGLSSKHALALVNYGGATSAELIALARAIRDAVSLNFGVYLEPEPVLVGVSID